MVEEKKRTIRAVLENSHVPVVLEAFFVLEDAW